MSLLRTAKLAAKNKPLAVAFVALLASGFFVVSGVLAAHTANVIISPGTIDVGQTKDLVFSISKDSGDDIKTVAISNEGTGFSNPTSVTCPSGWSYAGKLMGYYICTGSGLSNVSVKFNGVTAPIVNGTVIFNIQSTDINDEATSLSGSINVLTLSADASVVPTTVNTDQNAVLSLTVTNTGQDSINQISGSIDGFSLSGCSAPGWSSCVIGSNNFTLSGGSLSEKSSVVIGVSAIAPPTTDPRSRAFNLNVTGAAGGTAVANSQNEITIETPANLLISGTIISDNEFISNVSGANNTAVVSVEVTNSGEATANNLVKSLIIKDSSNVDISSQFTIAETDSITEVAGGLSETLSWTVTALESATEGLDQAEVSVEYSDANNFSAEPIPATKTNSGIFTVDNTAPTLPSISIASNNADPALAKVGDTITLSLVASENIQSPTVAITGDSATIIPGVDAKNWTATYVMLEGDAEGVVAFSVEAKDLAGNTSGVISATTEPATSVTFDKTPPTFGIINVSPSPAKSGTEVTVTFTASEDLQSDPVVTIDGQPATQFNKTDLTYVYKRILDGGETESAEAVVSISGTDPAGNYGVDNSGRLIIDFTAPTTRDDYEAKNDVWQKVDQTITLTPADATSGVASTKYCVDTVDSCDPTAGTDYAASPVTITAEGVNYFRYASVDNAGNIQAAVPKIVKIDKTIPSSSSITSLENGDYLKGNVTLNASAEDAISGIQKVEFYYASIPNKIGESTGPSYSVSWNTTLASNGTHEVYAIAFDKAGNLLESVPVSVIIDNVPPTISSYTLQVAGEEATENNNVFFSPNEDSVKDEVVIDTGFSELVVYHIRIKSGETLIKEWTGTATNPDPKTWNGKNTAGVLVDDGIYTLEITGEDNAGNTVVNTDKTITLDVTAPSVEAGADKIIGLTETTQNAEVSDSGSGIASYLWAKDSGLDTVSFGTPTAEDTTINANSDGARVLKLTVTDNAGNVGSDTMNFTRDTVVPTITNLTEPVADNVYRSGVELKFTPVDPAPGTALTCSYTINTTVITDSFPCSSGTEVVKTITDIPDHRHTITVSVTDAAQNVSVAMTPISFVVDTNNNLTVGASGADFTTIAEAVAKADDGDTIQISSDKTYAESVLMEKKLSLVGIGGTKPVITGLAPANYIIKINGTEANGSVIDNLEINGGGSAEGANGFDYGILVNNSGTSENAVEIKNSTVKNIWKNSGNGIGVESSSYVLAHDNAISSFHKRGIRFINSDGKFYSNDVKGDSIDGTTRVQNLVTLWSGSNVEIYDNTLHDAKSLGTPTWDSPAVFVSSFTGITGDNGIASYANIHNNEIYNGDTGIVVGSTYAGVEESSADINNNNIHNLNWAINFEKDTVLAVIHGNKFVENTKSVNADGITGPAEINAEANWWGYPTGPVADTVYAGVDYRPWCTNEACDPIDETAPIITVNTLTTNDTTPTITGTVIETNKVAVKITVNSKEYTAIVNEGNWSAEVTDALAEGTYKVIATAEDESGNIGTDTTTDELTIDTTEPMATVDYSTTDITKEDVIATITPNESITVTNNGGSLSYTFTTNGEFTFEFVDKAGNTGSVTAVVSNIDKEAPAAPIISSIASDNFINSLEESSVEVIGTAEADSLVNVTLSDGVNSISDSVQLSGGETNFSVTLDAPSLSEGLENITPSTTATDAAGNVSSAVTTPLASKDIVSPSVVSYTPANLAVGVDPTGSVTVTFSEEINSETVLGKNIYLVKNGEVVPVPASLSLSEDKKTVTLDPSETLANNSTYEVKVTTGVTDVAGNPLSEEKNWSFTTSGSYSFTLTKGTKGWNLVSLGVVPNDTNIATVLGTAKDNIESVWTYDNGDWKVYNPSNPEGANSLLNMTAGYGYWISYKGVSSATVSGPGNLILEGNNVPPSRTLQAGWNLIGYYQKENTGSEGVIASDALMHNLNNYWTMLLGYDNSSKQITSLSSSDLMKPGEGFWVLLDGKASDSYIYTVGQ